MADSIAKPGTETIEKLSIDDPRLQEMLRECVMEALIEYFSGDEFIHTISGDNVESRKPNDAAAKV